MKLVNLLEHVEKEELLSIDIKNKLKLYDSFRTSTMANPYTIFE